MQLLDPKDVEKTLQKIKRRPVDQKFKNQLFDDQPRQHTPPARSTWQQLTNIAAILTLICSIALAWYATKEPIVSNDAVDTGNPVTSPSTDGPTTKFKPGAKHYIVNSPKGDEIIQVNDESYLLKNFTVYKSREIIHEGKTFNLVEPREASCIVPISIK